MYRRIPPAGCPYAGSLKWMYLEAKTSELITLELNQLQDGSPGPACRISLSAADIEKIHAAKDMLTADVGYTSLGHFTLAFKQEFGVAPHL